MNEEVLNASLRKFLKTVGVTSQREIEKAIRAGAPIMPHKYLQKGQWCKVISGPLLGLEGIVVQTKGATRLVLQINMLGQAASVEIDIDMIEPIEQPSVPE